MNRLLFAVALVCSGSLASSAEDGAVEGPPAAAHDCAVAVSEKVQARYEGVRDLSARFTQETLNVAFGGESAAEEVTGNVLFAKPGRMRWEYEKPEPSLVVSDGQVLWIYDPVAREAQKLAVDRGYLSGAAIQFLLGEGRLLETFEVVATACPGEPEAGGEGSGASEPRAELELRPREPSTYERIDLVVDPATGWILATTVHDLFGNRTRVAFSGFTANQGFPDAKFRFEPPEGVRVLSLEPPEE